MQFSAARPDVVRAINQRWLLKFWQRHLGHQRVPRWQAVEAEDLSRLSDNLSFIDITGSGDDARFSIRAHGKMIATAYDSADCRGKHLNEMMPVNCRALALAAYRQTVENGCPVYTIQDVTDRNGRPVYFERLLLPFSRDGECVDRILASFEFISIDGAFEKRALLLRQAAPPVMRLSVLIQPRELA